MLIVQWLAFTFALPRMEFLARQACKFRFMLNVSSTNQLNNYRRTCFLLFRWLWSNLMGWLTRIAFYVNRLRFNWRHVGIAMKFCRTELVQPCLVENEAGYRSLWNSCLMSRPACLICALFCPWLLVCSWKAWLHIVIALKVVRGFDKLQLESSTSKASHISPLSHPCEH
jgi:hypothetical protein